MFFFFFQAEDGIRDYKVTGVQTCALPISRPRSAARRSGGVPVHRASRRRGRRHPADRPRDRKSTRLNSSHLVISYAVFCLKKKKIVVLDVVVVVTLICLGFDLVLDNGSTR